MINNHVLPRMASSCAILVVALAHCGCASMKSPSEWATAWKAKPTPKNPNDRETINYVGFGKKKDPKAPNSDELKSKLAVAGKESREAAFDKYLRQGNLGLTENRLEDAKRDYMRALELRPDHPDCHHRLAVIADKQGMFGQADDHYEAALKLRPRDPNLLSDIGYSYSLRGDDRRAESTLKEALNVSPSHTGAMFNLGAIYAKQGRYEDTVAMFRRGCPEAQAMQNVAKLFPQHPTNGANPDFAVARNTPPANTPRQEPPLDLLNMNPEQLKAEMNRRKQEGIERRRQQQMAELPPRQEWMTDVPPQNQRPNSDPRSGQPIVLGPGGSQNQNQSPNPNPMNDLPTVTPGGGNSGFANNGSFNGNGGQPNGFGQGQPNVQAGNGYPQEQPGSRPNMDVWDGASRDQRIQPTGGQNQDLAGNGSFGASRNVPPATIHYGPPTNRQIPGVNLQPSLPNMNEPQRVPDMRGADMRGVDQNDNLAAAQLGMNVGGLFPALPPDAGSGQGAGQRQPAMETRFGAEFPSPPQYQNPVELPGRGSLGAGDQRQGNSMNSWGNSNPQPSRSPSRFANFEEGSSLSPASPTADWGQNRVTPAGGATGSVRFGNEPVERLPNDPHSNWAEKPNMNGATPFNGPWPANSGNANGNSPNSIPMWNGGQSAPQARSAPGQPSDYPEQYPYSRGR